MIQATGGTGGGADTMQIAGNAGGHVAVNVSGGTDGMKIYQGDGTTTNTLDIDESSIHATGSGQDLTITAAGGDISHGDDNLLFNGGFINLNQAETVSAGSKISFKTDTITPTEPGTIEVISNAANRLTSEYALNIELDPDPTSANNLGGAHILLEPSGTMAGTSSTQHVAIRGQVQGTIVANTSKPPDLSALTFIASNNEDLVGADKTGFNWQITGADLTGMMLAAGKTSTDLVTQTVSGLKATATMSGTWNADSTTPGFAAAVRGITTDNLTDIDSTGTDGSIVNSYVFHGTAATAGAHTGTLNNWMFYGSNAGDSYQVGDWSFGQTDKAERIGSDADGTLDLYAGTSIDLHSGLNVTGDISSTGGRVLGTTRVTSTPYTILSTDHNIFIDTDGSDITANLPAGVDGEYHRITNAGTSGNDVIMVPNGAELLDGANASKAFARGVITLTYETTEGWQ